MTKYLLAVLFALTPSFAQVMDATQIGEPVNLRGNWRYQTGDNPQWANGTFDDSGWPLLSTDQTWDRQGLQGIRGYIWCRATIKLPPSHGQLSLQRSDIGPSEVFINGKEIDTTGRFPPHPLLIQEFPKVVLLPKVGDQMTIALRYWIPPIFQHIGNIGNDLVVGSQEAIERNYKGALFGALASRIPYLVIQVLQAILLVSLLVLFFFQRERVEYLFLALALFWGLVGGINADVQNLAATPMVFSSLISTAALALAAVSMMEFVFRFIGISMPVWLRVYQIAIPLLGVLVAAFWAGWLSESAINLWVAFYLTPYWLLVPGAVMWHFLRGSKEAGFLAISITLLMADDMLGLFGWILYRIKLLTTPMFLGDLHTGSIVITKDALFTFLFLLSIAGLIIHRYNTVHAAEARTHSELEAARSMQSVMVPKTVTAPGYMIEAAYIPAQEVGGDFFQFLPYQDGSLLIVIGDVSGKGVKAAMMVSMILGLLRRTSELTHSPGTILGELNRLLIGYTDGTFATCCCALLTPRGDLIAANAGHLAPYCNGTEIELSSGLPLGIAPDSEYEEKVVPMKSRKRWVFLSDGVIEARSKAGELYGFERTLAISTQPAEHIAEAAQSFGQEDDITVLGVTAI